MRKQVVLSLLFTVYYCSTFSQPVPVEWINQTGGSGAVIGRFVYSDLFGNVYTCGNYSGQIDLDPGSADLYAVSNGDEDLFIQKFDGSGNLLWALSLGGEGEDRAACISTDYSGNILVTGFFADSVNFDPSIPANYTVAAGDRDIFVLKLDEDGNFMFVKTMGGTTGSAEGTSIVTDESDAIYITGYFLGSVDFDPGISTSFLTPSYGSDIFILKLDASGELVWVKQPAGTTDEKGLSIALDSNNDILITGNLGNNGSCDFDPGPGSQIYTASGGNAGFLLKLDNDGIFIWAKSLDCSIASHPYSLTIDSNNSTIVTGYFSGTLYNQPGSSIAHLPATGPQNGFVQKFDTNGNLVWMKKIAGTGAITLYSVSVGPSDAIYLTGSFYNTIDFDPGVAENNYTTTEGCDVFVEKLNQDGEFDWVQTVGVWDYNLASFAGATNEAGELFLLSIFRDTVSSNPLLGPDFIADGSTDMLLLKFNAALSVEDENINTGNISVYPNPTNQTIYIDLSLQTGITIVSIYDVAGNLLLSTATVSSIFSADISAFSRGIYLINIKSENADEIFKITKI